MAELPDLITLDEATAALAAAGEAPTGARLAALPGAIAAASALARRWCGDRAFTRQTLVEDHAPALDGTILLGQMPVLRVVRVAGGRAPGLIARADRATNRRATVAGSEDGAGLVLAKVVAGVASTSTLAFADAPTLADLAPAIAAFGAGWSAEVAPGMGDCPAADLALDPTPRSAIPAAALEVYAEDVAVRGLDRATGLLDLGMPRAARTGDGYFLPHAGAGGPVRVTYDAGFDAIPAPVRQAVALLAAYLLDVQGRDLGLQFEQVGTGSYTARDPAGDLPPEARSLLAPYRLARC